MEKLNLHLGEIEPNKELDNHIEEASQERIEKTKRLLELVEKINESDESLSFSGIHQEAYLKMKQTDDEFPGYTTPTDEIIERCKKEGIKVVLGKHPESGNVFILPADSNDIEMDSIAPHQLEIDNVKNKNLEELIQLTTKKR